MGVWGVFREGGKLSIGPEKERIRRRIAGLASAGWPTSCGLQVAAAASHS